MRFWLALTSLALAFANDLPNTPPDGKHPWVRAAVQKRYLHSESVNDFRPAASTPVEAGTEEYWDYEIEIEMVPSRTFKINEQDGYYEPWFSPRQPLKSLFEEVWCYKDGSELTLAKYSGGKWIRRKFRLPTRQMR